MIILRIVFEDLRFLDVVEITNQVIRPELLPPFLAVDKPAKDKISILADLLPHDHKNFKHT